MDLNYDALMSFAAFAERLNFTQTAKHLGISQPALHQKIAKLGESLGVELYVRRGRELSLTPAGRELAAHARHVDALTQDTLSRITGTEQAVVRVASGPTTLQHLIGPRVANLKDGPYALRLTMMTTTAATEALRESRLDLAVGSFEGRREGLDTRPWITSRQVVVVPRSHPLARAERACPEDLDGESLIVPPDGHPARRLIDEALQNISWTPAVEALGYDLAIAFVAHGMGLTFAHDFIALPPGLAALPFRTLPPTQLEIAVRDGSPHPGALWLRAQLLGVASA